WMVGRSRSANNAAASLPVLLSQAPNPHPVGVAAPLHRPCADLARPSQVWRATFPTSILLMRTRVAVSLRLGVRQCSLSYMTMWVRLPSALRRRETLLRFGRGG